MAINRFVDFFDKSTVDTITPELFRIAKRLWERMHALLDRLRSDPALCALLESFVLFSFDTVKSLYRSGMQAIWSECAGEVARFGMYTEERDIWAKSCQMWYLCAVNLNPGEGRLLHHIATTTQTGPMTELFYLTKSLCAERQFCLAREPISKLFNRDFQEPPGPDIAAVKLHGIVMMDGSDEDFEAGLLEYTSALRYGIADAPWYNTFSSFLSLLLEALTLEGKVSACSHQRQLSTFVRLSKR